VGPDLTVRPTDIAGEGAFTALTLCCRSLAGPLRGFMRTETGGALVLLAATLAALAWANEPRRSRTQLPVW
jgi:hypothetical protein